MEGRDGMEGGQVNGESRGVEEKREKFRTVGVNQCYQCSIVTSEYIGITAYTEGREEIREDRKEGKEEGTKGQRDERRKGGREEGRKGGREEGRKGGREDARKGKRGGRKGGKEERRK